jgi:hypothetical protein
MGPLNGIAVAAFRSTEAAAAYPTTYYTSSDALSRFPGTPSPL